MVSPARQLAGAARARLVAPAWACSPRRVHTGWGTAPYSSRRPPCTFSPRAMPLLPLACGWPVRVMVARFRCGAWALPMSSAPLTWMAAALSSTSAAAKRSVPSMRRLPSSALLVSSTTVAPTGTTTSAPAAGTAPPQVLGSLQRSSSGCTRAVAAAADDAAHSSVDSATSDAASRFNIELPRAARRCPLPGRARRRGRSRRPSSSP